MKAKSFIACAFAASTLWAGSTPAVMPSGPQGTGAYGAPNAAVPLAQTVPPGYVYPSPVYDPTLAPVPDTSANRDVLADVTAVDRDPPRADARRPATRNWVHQGPSWATNPPAPAP